MNVHKNLYVHFFKDANFKLRIIVLMTLASISSERLSHCMVQQAVKQEPVAPLLGLLLKGVTNFVVEQERLTQEIIDCREVIIRYIREKRYDEAISLLAIPLISKTTVIESAKSGHVPLLILVLGSTYNVYWILQALVEATIANQYRSIQLIINELRSGLTGGDTRFLARSYFRIALERGAAAGSIEAVDELIIGVSVIFGYDWSELLPAYGDTTIKTLYAAVKSKRFEMVRFLLSQDALYFRERDRIFEQVIAKAKELGVHKIVYLLLSYYHRNNFYRMIERFAHVEDSTKRREQRLIILARIKLHPSVFIHKTDKDNNTLLHKAVEWGDLFLFKLMLSYNPTQLIARNVRHETPFVLAIGMGKFNMSEGSLLVKRLYQAFMEKDQRAIEAIKGQLEKTMIGCVFSLAIQCEAEKELKLLAKYDLQADEQSEVAEKPALVNQVNQLPIHQVLSETVPLVKLTVYLELRSMMIDYLFKK